MAQEVIMPKWGLTMKEGKVSRWLKAEGDPVKAGEPLFEVETDKITNSVEAPADGVLAKIIVPEGGVAAVQAVLWRHRRAGRDVWTLRAELRPQPNRPRPGASSEAAPSASGGGPGQGRRVRQGHARLRASWPGSWKWTCPR